MNQDRFLSEGFFTMLEGCNVNIRLITEADVKELISLVNNLAERGDHISSRMFVEPTYLKRIKEDGWWIDNEGSMVITDKKDKLLGHIGFFDGIRHEAGFEIGYSIFHEADRGKGYGTQALRIFSAYLFELKPIARLHMMTVVGNVASRRIAEKCGFKHEGTLKKCTFCRGQYVDLDLLSLLREDCPSLREALQSKEL